MVMSSTCVIDASATAPWILPDEVSLASEQLFERVFSGEVKLASPSLWSLECISFIRNAVRRNRINKEAAQQSIWALGGLPIDLVSFTSAEYFALFNLSIRYDLTSYDTAYFYLAQKTGANLITLDSDLLKLKEEYPFIFRPDEI